MRPQERRSEFFQQEGFLVVKDFFPVEEMARAVAGQEEFYQGHFDSEPQFGTKLPGKQDPLHRRRKRPRLRSQTLACPTPGSLMPANRMATN